MTVIWFFPDLNQFTIAGVHVPPDEAVEELQFMDDVYDWAVENLGTKVKIAHLLPPSQNYSGRYHDVTVCDLL